MLAPLYLKTKPKRSGMDNEPVNTGEIQANKGRFTKGDKRINRKGRPKSFDALRKLAQSIAAEELQSTDGDVITRIEALLRVMSTSRNPADRKTFLEYAFGKPKDEVDISNSDGSLKPPQVIEVIKHYKDE